MAAMAADPDQLLRRARESQIAAVLPAALAGRLEAMAAAADEAGVPTSRKELVAAILYAAPTSARALRARLNRYHNARVQDALVDGQSDEWVLNPRGAPGPAQRRLLNSPAELSEQKSFLKLTGEELLDLSDGLQEGGDIRIGVRIPEPLNPRVDGLVQRAQGAGTHVTRQELVAALILAAPSTGHGLARLLQHYRVATVGDAVIPGADPSPYLEVVSRRPGRPGRATLGPNSSSA
jgi:hypothetical protein